MMKMLRSKIRVNDGFGVSKVMTSRLQTGKVENRQKNSTMWNFKHGNWTKMTRKHKKLVEQIGVREQAVSYLPQEMGNIQKSDRWVPHELNDR